MYFSVRLKSFVRAYGRLAFILSRLVTWLGSLVIFILCRVPVGTRSDAPDNHRTAQCTMSFISYPLGGDIEVSSVNRRMGAHSPAAANGRGWPG